jgi:hypothetical protein
VRNRVTQIAVVIGAAVLVALPGTAVEAADGVGGIACTQHPDSAECDVNARTHGDPTSPTSTQSASGSGDERACRLRRLDPQPPPPADTEAGAWYTRDCPANTGMAQSEAIWLDARETAEQLALQARSRLRLPAPVIRLNPAGDQLVRLPTWLSLAGSSWTEQAATASVPGISVTATASPARATWRMGDGSTVACAGPGTPWRHGINPTAPSPDCGHRYVRSSASAPAGTYLVTVTVAWQVTWASPGASGQMPELTATAAKRARVVESQALIAG